MDPHTLLELEPGASSEEIKKAWKRLARKHHPDLNPDDPMAIERFRRIKDAYEALLSGDVPTGPAEMDDDWLDLVEWMVQVRQRAVLDTMIPRFIGAYGTGSALGWALQRTTDLEAAAEALPPQKSQWRLRRLRMSVVLVETPNAWRLAAIDRSRNGRIQLLLFASALWARRPADEQALRELVFATVEQGLAAAVPIAFGTGMTPPTLEEAYEVDRGVRRQNRIIGLIWASAAALVVSMGWIMLTSG